MTPSLLPPHDQPARPAHSRGTYIGVAIAVIAMAVAGFWPPLAGPGYESALVAGLVLPSTAAAVAAASLASRPLQPFSAFCEAVAHGVRLAAA
ncbi:MAG: hypothetical protein HY744_20775, partial [Deltaproteobacteria bacterium]|nr:hypothetical protein [Deltaproteobacteria bacterium]